MAFQSKIGRNAAGFLLALGAAAALTAGVYGISRVWKRAKDAAEDAVCEEPEPEVEIILTEEELCDAEA